MLLLNKFEIISVNISSNICLSFSAFLLTFSNISKLEDLFILCYRLLRLCFFGLIFSLSLSLSFFSLVFRFNNCSLLHWTFILYWLINYLFVLHNVVLITGILFYLLLFSVSCLKFPPLLWLYPAFPMVSIAEFYGYLKIVFF